MSFIIAKEWALGYVKRAPAARAGQDGGITQPRAHSLADPCTRLHLNKEDKTPRTDFANLRRVNTE